MCSTCSSVEFKYKCPKCEAQTCSLDCVKKHKEVNSCDGVRVQTRFLPLNEFNELELLNDYRFLENIASHLDNSQRDSSLAKFSSTEKFKERNRIIQECQMRGINLKLPPLTFPGSKSRIPYFNEKEKKLCWCIKWIFVLADVDIEDERVAENLTLGQALESHLCVNDLNSDSKLMYYISASFRGITPLIKVPKSPNNSNLYEELDFSETILKNLQGKFVQEFLTVYLVLTEHKYMYLIDK